MGRRTEMMRALLLTERGLEFAPQVPVPQPGPGEALIRVHMAGICATDLEMVLGYQAGFRGVLGHEFAGEVVETAGDVASGDGAQWLGRRVVGEINIGCGRCELCGRGLSKHCRARQTVGIAGRDGVFADYVTMPLANLHALPDDLPDERAVFVEPLAAALQILEQIPIGPSDRVAVIGDGRLGLLIAQVVAMTGCDLCVIGRHAGKLALLHGWGIPNTVISSAQTVAELGAGRAQRHPEGTRDVVIEATGSADGFALARQIVRPAGTVALKSTFAAPRGLPPPEFDLTSLVVDEVQVVGSRCGPFAPAIRLLQEQRVHVDALVHARYSLDNGLQAMERAAQRGVLKVLLTM